MPDSTPDQTSTSATSGKIAPRVIATKEPGRWTSTIATVIILALIGLLTWGHIAHGWLHFIFH